MRDRQHRRVWAMILGVVALVALFRATTVDETEPVSRTITDAGFDETTFVLVGGSRVSDHEDGQFKRSLLAIQSDDLRGTGSVMRVAEQVRARPMECLGQTYDGERDWTSSTLATGSLDFHDAGMISVDLLIVEVVRGPLSVNPICQEITGTYTGVSGELADVEGRLVAGFASTRMDQYWTFDPAG